MGIKVKATIMHFRHGKRIRPGTVFELNEGEKPSRGMELVEEQADAKPAKGKGKAAEPATFSEIAKKDGKDQQAKGAQDLV